MFDQNERKDLTSEREIKKKCLCLKLIAAVTGRVVDTGILVGSLFEKSENPDPVKTSRFKIKIKKFLSTFNFQCQLNHS